jgi:hypothetical protein
MKTTILSDQETRQSGFTHKFTIPSTALTAGATSQAITLTALPAGSLITNAAWRLKTNFAGGASSALTLQVGVTGNADAMIAPASVLNGDTPIAVTSATGDMSDENKFGLPVAAATNVIATFTATGANVSTLTSGEVDVFIAVANLASL